MTDSRINGNAREKGPSEDPPRDSRLPMWRNPAYRFLLALVLGSIALSVSAIREIFEPATVWLEQMTASLEYHMIRPFTSDVVVSDTILSFKGFEVIIVEECTGIYEAFIYGAAVLSFPTTWIKKGIGVGVGVPILYVINLARIAVLLLVGHYQPGLFEFMHLYFWQVTLVVMILSVWLLWAKLVVSNPRFDFAPPRQGAR